MAIGRFITPDELIWVYRSVQFREALLQGRWADTLTTGHPGVTTMWLGTVGISLQLWLRPFSHSTYQWITQLAHYNPDNMAAYRQLAHFLTAARLVVIAVNSLGIVAIYHLSQRVFGLLAAMLITAFLAFDPFMVGLSSLLHVDALLTTFVTLSLLALAIWVHSDGRSPQFLFFSAFFTGLAILSKSPALLLLPFTAFILLIKSVSFNDGKVHFPARQLFQAGIMWLAICLGTLFLLLPALWLDPATAVQTVTSSANRHIEAALRPTFFWGQMAYEHGPLFYPVAVLFRLGPLVLVGLLLAGWGKLRGWQKWRQDKVWQRPSLTTLIFLLWPPLYIAAITIAEKKFDRYALPVIPVLVILAAMGWAWLRPQRPKILFTGLLATQIILLLLTLPYPLTSYNPLLGGTTMARRVLPIGWGEAIGSAGQWLSAQPGSDQQTAVSSIPSALAPFFSGQTLPIAESAQANYRILTASSLQADPNALSKATNEGPPLHIIRFNGLDQAWIVAQHEPQRPSPLISLPAPFTFDNRVQLLAADTTYAAEAVQVRLRWRLLQNGRYALQLTLTDENDNIWHQLNASLLNQTDFYPEHWAEGETPQINYAIPPPKAIPPGHYQVQLSLFDVAGAQLPLLTDANRFQGVIYNLPHVTIPPATQQPVVSNLDLGTVVNQSWLNNSLILWGYHPLPPTLLSGSRTTLDLTWQAAAPLPPDVQIRLQLGDTVTDFPLSRYPSSNWRLGEVIHEKYELSIPADIPAGQYTLTAQPITADGRLSDSPVTLASLEVIATDRLFQLPPTIETPLAIQFGSNIFLRGVDGPAVADDSLQLTLYWQTDQPPSDLYTVFVHVLAADGSTIAQADQWPNGRPTNTLAPQEVVIDKYTIPLPADSQPYQLAIGLYTAHNGLRLPLTDATSTAYPDDQLLLPLSP